jgi:16S rRNA (guanine527-N7)-methyltransferase
MPTVEIARIATLLSSFDLDEIARQRIASYVDLLLKWNARMNLTAIRDPEEIVTRHFGESLFAARQLFPDTQASGRVADIGSGAGFPGIPVALFRPCLSVTLIEAHGKKATFLREVVRSLELKNVTIMTVRAEEYGGAADVVMMRAVEQFASILPFSAHIVSPGGRLACLFGSPQVEEAKAVLGAEWSSGSAVYFPGSTQRVLWIAERRKP